MATLKDLVDSSEPDPDPPISRSRLYGPAVREDRFKVIDYKVGGRTVTATVLTKLFGNYVMAYLDCLFTKQNLDIYIGYYVLRGIFPLCYDPETGLHDEELYNKILPLAVRYGQDKLVVWIRRKLYYRAVRQSVDPERPVFGRAEMISIPRVVNGVEDTIDVPAYLETKKETIVDLGWLNDQGVAFDEYWDREGHLFIDSDGQYRDLPSRYPPGRARSQLNQSLSMMFPIGGGNCDTL